MSCVLEISGIVSYNDNTQRSFLAVNDGNSFVIRDENTLKDAIPTIRNLLSAVGTIYSIPTIYESSLIVKDVIVEINCRYTINSENYVISLISSSITGILIEGNGSWEQFITNNHIQFESIVRMICPGSTIHPGAVVYPIYFRINNNSNDQHGITFRIYKRTGDNIDLDDLLFERTIGAAGQYEMFIYDRIISNRFWCSAVRDFERAPYENEINTEISVLGIVSCDISINGGISTPFQMVLTNIVF